MIKTVILLLIANSLAFALEGPDFMLIGQSYALDRNDFSFCSAYQEDEGLKATFQDASLYHIGRLDWRFAGASYSYRQWTACGSFRSYGIDNLYESSRYSLMVHRLIIPNASIGLGYSHRQIIYGENLYNSSSNSFGFDAGVKFDAVCLDAIIGNLPIGAHNVLVDGDPEVIISGNWLADEVFTIYGLYYKDYRDHDRFRVGQDLILSNSLVINAGLLSSPEVYFFGIEIIYKRLAIGYTFYDMAGLPNCSKLTLSVR